ncbi:MAG: GIY-YIG nuclease family protein [Otoolea sp.]
MNSEYNYAGVELTPNLFAELLILLFDGKQFKRTTAIEMVTKYHEDSGGILGKKDYVSVFKKACQNLSMYGLSNIGYGTWRLNYKIHEVEVIEEDVNDTVDYAADKTIGSGNYSVYVYYYDTYKKHAENCGQSVWECKIGRTDKDPLQRIFGHAGTCYPELPHIALVMKCSNSFQLESALHNILKLRKRWLEDAPGTEWFLTSPTEVESLYQMIVGE